MTDARLRYHDELRAVEQSAVDMARMAEELFAKALRALIDDDLALCEEVITGDDRIDDAYLDTEQRVLNLFALQTPVASDLRLLTSMLHINVHLERIGDMAVNLAKITRLASGLPRSSTVLAHLEEMGSIALKMVAASMEAFSTRDLELCRKLPEMDDPIDRLNRGMLQEVLAISDDKRMLEWGIRMHVVSRQIERVGDHAVDIAEQVAFMLTGEFREFTDASHPEMRPTP